jgi:hypothetical protein
MALDTEAFIRHYIVTMLWAETDGDPPVPLDSVKSAADLAPETLAKCRADCLAFIAANRADLESAAEERGDSEVLGHDFWLTRNGHGAGFWDGDYSEALGDRLTAACKKVGEASPYISDDGMVYL